jgi:hypothetical protein
MTFVSDRPPERTPHKPPPPPEPEPEPEPKPEEPAARQAKVLSITEEQLERLLRAARGPVIDERKERRMRMWKEHNQQLQKDDLKVKVGRFRSCNHMQLPGSVVSGCSLIAWATQTDQKRRGVCQRCHTVFSPVREECISDEVWESYRRLIAIPTHPAGNQNYIYQSA